MKKLANDIVDKKYIVVSLFVLLAIVCSFLIPFVNINDDITKYLPKDSETRIGMDIMDEEFKNDESSTLSIMFNDVIGHEEEILNKLLKIKNVDSISYDETDNYNIDTYTLYTINVEHPSSSKEAKYVYNKVNEIFKDYKYELSGSINNENKEVLQSWIVITSIACAMIILLVMCNSYIEPFIILFTIGLAVFINKGTNVMFNSVSNVTDSICAILQMALSMDYSIMLINRYNQEKTRTKQKDVAMKRALYNSFSSITSSSLTTIVGLMALVFMTFTIGKDLGIVLAKGVFLSLVCIFACIPGIVLVLDKYIEKTTKKRVEIRMEKFGRITYNLRYVTFALFIIFFIGSFILKGNLAILYTSKENDEVAKVFEENNQIAVVYNNKYEDSVAKICEGLESSKVDSVLCYGNTINQKLTYENMNPKLKDLGSKEEVEEYLLKIVYYNYYNKTNETSMTAHDLIKFIENDVYNNKEFNKNIDENTKNNINKLKYFTTSEEVEKTRKSGELATILGMDKNTIDKLMLLNQSKTTTTSIKLDEFIEFIQNNQEISKEIPENTKKSLELLSIFTNKDTINKEYTSSEMAKIFGINEELMSNLYTYYFSINGFDKNYTINEFSTILLNNYSNNLDQDTINKLVLLNKFSDKSFINTSISSKELSTILNIDEEVINNIILMKEINNYKNNDHNIKEFIETIITLKTNTNILDSININEIVESYSFYNSLLELEDKSYTKEELIEIFNPIDENIINRVYEENNLEESTLSLSETIEYMSNLEILDESLYKKVNLLSLYFDEERLNSNQNIETIANTLYLDENTITYLVNVLVSMNVTNEITPNELVNILLSLDSIDENTKNNLNYLNTIMSVSENVYNYEMMAQITGLDMDTVRLIYANTISNTNTITKENLLRFILENKDNINIDKSLIEKLQQLDNILKNIQAGNYFNSAQMSNILNIDKSKTSLIYALYDEAHNNIKDISINTLVKLILNESLANLDYSKYTTLTSLNVLIDDTINYRKYNNDMFYTRLVNLTDNLDKNLIDLVYIYYGSINNYNNNYKMTVEEFINYLNEDIITDSKYNDFIDSTMRDRIISNKDKIIKAKNKLVGKNYSRLVINTKYDLENKETFAFIKDLKDKFSKLGKDYYLVGDSPMAYELSKTFNKEFDTISLLTMALIFLVVAFTFKSIFVPLILTLVIECALYITMGILSLFGGEVYFIALLIVQSILLGATIDYAILYTSYYIDYRNTYNKKGAIINAYNSAIHTILTSSSVLVIVTFIIGFFANAIASKICLTISQGTLCSTILVIFILPAILACLDKLIVNKN